MDLEEKTYLWEHFKFNAEQRLKAFNFFVVFSVFANGGVFTAIEKEAHPVILGMTGLFICLLSISFAVIDARSQWLLRLSNPGLELYEKRFPEHSRLFELDSARKSGWKLIRYTWAFRVLFGFQFMLGIGVIVFVLTKP